MYVQHFIAYCMKKKGLKENSCNILGQKKMSFFYDNIATG